MGAEDVKPLGLFHRLRPSAVVTIAGRAEAFQTRPDGRHGEDPRWNERFTFTLPEWLVATSATRVEVELYAEAARLHHRGTVHIPLEPARLDGKVRKYFILADDGNKRGNLLAALHLGQLKGGAAPVPLEQEDDGASPPGVPSPRDAAPRRI